ncbi:hypothetical protein F4780DRAFT_129482 [Xylariomycetidae sp. FL0641]|nr:hypothetical protein F4780DRAFT_129482 [Xylariomycetidae sp. FL0641]
MAGPSTASPMRYWRDLVNSSFWFHCLVPLSGLWYLVSGLWFRPFTFSGSAVALASILESTWSLGPEMVTRQGSRSRWKAGATIDAQGLNTRITVWFEMRGRCRFESSGGESASGAHYAVLHEPCLSCPNFLVESHAASPSSACFGSSIYIIGRFPIPQLATDLVGLAWFVLLARHPRHPLQWLLSCNAHIPERRHHREPSQGYLSITQL